MTVRETTTPALADTGMRSFVVRLHEFHEVEIIAAHHRDDGRHYDEPVKLVPCNEALNNSDLAVALIQLASKTVSTVGASIAGE